MTMGTSAEHTQSSEHRPFNPATRTQMALWGGGQRLPPHRGAGRRRKPLRSAPRRTLCRMGGQSKMAGTTWVHQSGAGWKYLTGQLRTA